MSDLQKQFEAEFKAEYGAILEPSFFSKIKGDYKYPEAQFAWLGYQTAQPQQRTEAA